MSTTTLSGPRKAKARARAGTLTIPVAYGTVSINGPLVSVPLTIQRRDLALEQADEFLCGRRLVGRILARPEGAGATQGPLPGMDGDITVDVTAEAKRFAVGPKEITTSLAFLLADVDIEKLSHYAGREGLLTVDGVTDLTPATRPRPASDDGGE